MDGKRNGRRLRAPKDADAALKGQKIKPWRRCGGKKGDGNSGYLRKLYEGSSRSQDLRLEEADIIVSIRGRRRFSFPGGGGRVEDAGKAAAHASRETYAKIAAR